MTLLCLAMAVPFGSCDAAASPQEPTGENQTPGKDDEEDDEPEKPVVNPGDPRDLNSYDLLWSDEFDADELDQKYWSIEVNGDGGGNRELQYYREENVSFGKEPSSDRDCLILTARKEAYKGKTATSGRITSKQKFEFQYGRIDALIRVPKTANGLWPAFWLMGNIHEVGWPACGEIDILEMGHSNGIKNNTQDRYFNGACHWGPRWTAQGYPNYAKSSTWTYSLQDDFHLWTLIWDEESIREYVDLDKYPDSNPYYSMNITDKSSESSPGLYFHKPFHILFNLAVGGNFTGIHDINNVTALDAGDAKMYVDYVRVYQPKKSE